MSTIWLPPTFCLIYGSEQARTADMAAIVNACDNSPQIDEVTRLTSLRERLSQHAYDFAVILLDHADDNLPACLFRYPELKVLAVTPTKKVHYLESWLAQGAFDVVSSQRRGKCQQALQRISDECRVRAQLRLVSLNLSSEHQLQKILLNSWKEAVLVWQHGSVLASNSHFDALIDCHPLDGQSRSVEWKHWLSTSCYAQIYSLNMPTSGKIVISNRQGTQYEASIERLCHNNIDALLIKLNTSPLDDSLWNVEKEDTATGALLPEAFVNAMDSWLRSTTKKRYIVAQICINERSIQSDDNAENSTVKELLSYRIATLLQEEFQKGSLIGRTGPTSMTLMPCNKQKQARQLATRIKKCLGTIGGLIDDTNSIRVTTLTLTPNALSASEVVRRLNRVQLIQTIDSTPTPMTQVQTAEDIPVLRIRT